MAVEQCIFCGTDLGAGRLELPSSRTGEHLFADWVRSRSKFDRLHMFMADENGANEQRAPPLGNLEVKVVCKDCNNGWMSQLETAVAPVMLRLFDGTRVDRLADQERETIARWAGKTAIVLSFATAEKWPVPGLWRPRLHPKSEAPPSFAVLHTLLRGPVINEIGYMHLPWPLDVPIVNSCELLGTRTSLCLSNHCFTVDFPPSPDGVGVRYDLTSSGSSQIWPYLKNAGGLAQELNDATCFKEVLRAVQAEIKTTIDLNTLRANP